eukprot:TRINITY_DN3752_c0_g5_i1.p1 TRINITY_DN3752_c0_g5~~TRINITY_DN3752_c0_g5_i1.p1  ORF type:complete len:303 (+),score=14.99 TRINITY_DN3752_c0_g5_i1:365-1273(+)
MLEERKEKKELEGKKKKRAGLEGTSFLATKRTFRPQKTKQPVFLIGLQLVGGSVPTSNVCYLQPLCVLFAKKVKKKSSYYESTASRQSKKNNKEQKKAKRTFSKIKEDLLFVKGYLSTLILAFTNVFQFSLRINVAAIQSEAADKNTATVTAHFFLVIIVTSCDHCAWDVKKKKKKQKNEKLNGGKKKHTSTSLGSQSQLRVIVAGCIIALEKCADILSFSSAFFFLFFFFYLFRTTPHFLKDGQNKLFFYIFFRRLLLGSYQVVVYRILSPLLPHPCHQREMAHCQNVSLFFFLFLFQIIS